MAYTATEWKDGDLITAERLNKLEQGVQNEQVGPQGLKGDTGETGPQGPAGQAGAKGDTGDAGASVTAITLTVSGGAVTGGKATLSDGSEVTITVTEG